MVAMGPDTTPVRSNTRTPDSDPDMSLLLLVDQVKYAHPGLHPARPGTDGPDRRRQSGAERRLNQEREDILAIKRPRVRKRATVFRGAGRLGRMTQSESRWGHSRRGSEARREPLGAAESGCKRDFGDSVAGLDQPALSLFEPNAQDEAMRRRSGGLLERPQKMPLAETDDTAHRGERQPLSKIVAHVFLKPKHAARGQGVAQRFAFEFAAANDPGNMRQSLVRPAFRKEFEEIIRRRGLPA
jgi:hypothetical protein